MVLLPDTDHENALMSAERFRAAVAAIDNLERAVSGSFGISTYEPGKSSILDYKSLATKLLEQADKALYCSKDLGKNRVSHFMAIAQAIAQAESA